MIEIVRPIESIHNRTFLPALSPIPCGRCGSGARLVRSRKEAARRSKERRLVYRAWFSTLMPTNSASAAHIETCGVHFPRLMSDADALQQPAASAISESFTLASPGRISRRNSSGS